MSENTNNMETKTSVFQITQAYADEPKRSAIKNFSLAGVGNLEINASKNLTTTTINVAKRICSLDIPLSLVCTGDDSLFRLSIDESVKKCEFNDGSSGYVYVNAKGETLLFKELFYKVNNDGAKTYVNMTRDQISIKDGILYDTEDGKTVFIEYKTRDGWTMIPKIEGFKNISLVDTRDEEEKQYQEQCEYYKDLLDSYVLVEKINTDTASTINISSAYVGGYSEEKHTTLLNTLQSDTTLLLTKTDALSYESISTDLMILHKEKVKNQERKSLLEKELSNIEKSIADFRDDASYNMTFYNEKMESHWPIEDGWEPSTTPVQDGHTSPWDSLTQGGILTGNGITDSYLDEEEALRYVKIRFDSSTANPLDIYVSTFAQFLDTTSGRYTNLSDYFKEARYYFELNLDKDTEVIIPRDIATKYASILLQKSMYEDEIAKLGDSDYSTAEIVQVDGETTKVLKDRISALNLQKEYLEAKAGTTLEELEKCRKEYATSKLNYDTYISTKPEFAITNGEYVKSFNQSGQLVSISQGQSEVKVLRDPNSHKIISLYTDEGQEVFVEYHKNGDYSGNIKSIVDSLGNRTVLSYTITQVDEITSIHTAQFMYNDIDIGAFTFDNDYRVTAVVSDTNKLKTVLTYTDGKLSYVTQYSLSTTIPSTEISELTLEEIEIRESSISGENLISFVTDNLDETYRFKENGELTGRYLIRDGLVSDATIYDYASYGEEEDLPSRDCIRTADKSCLDKDILVDFNIVDSRNCYRNLNTFNNPETETITGRELEKQGVKSITTVFTYDDMQNVVKKTATVTLTDNTVAYVTHTGYNYANGILVKEITYVEGEEKTHGKHVTEYEYSDDGKVKKTSYNTLQSSDKMYEESVYDKNGLKLCDYDVTGQHKIEYAYNKDKSIREISLPNGAKFTYGYDSHGNVTSISQSTLDGVENSTDRVYESSKVIELRSSNNKVNYTYDEKNRVKTIKLNGTTVANHTYTEIDSLTLPKGESTVTYNDVDKESITRGYSSYASYKTKNGQLLKEEVCGSALNYEYDANNINVAKVDDTFHMRTDSYTYDNLDRLTNYHRYYSNTEDYDEDITYDNLGNVISIINSEEQTYSYSYKDDSTNELEKTSVFSYDIYPDTDCNGRNVGKDIRHGSRSIAKQKIEYLKIGDHTTSLPSRISYANNDSAALGDISMTLKYSYDNMGNVSKIYKNGLLTTKYTYDGLNRLIREDNRDFGKTYRIDYDDKGNIIGKYTYSFTLCSMNDLYEKVPTSTQTYEYALQSDRLCAINGNVITYNTYGYPARYGADDKFCNWYDNYLSGFGSNTFTRDNRGRRIKKNNILFIYDSQDRVIKQSNGVEFFYDHTGVAGIVYNGTSYTYEKDLFGNVISILDSNGRRMVQYAYDAWGNHKITDGYGYTITSSTHIGIINPIRYRSYYYDTETGLYYLNSRYYDPVIGRFISPDDVDYINPETINGLNLYAYCANNPVMNVDPTGHDFWKWFFGALLVIGVTLLTAGAAGLVAGAIGVTAATTNAVMISATVSGLIAGGTNLLVQGITSNWQTIDYGSLALSSFVGATSGGISAGFGQLSKSVTYGTRLLAHKGAQASVNTLISWGGYVFSSAVSGEEPTLEGFLLATVGGVFSGATFNWSKAQTFALMISFEIAWHANDFIKWAQASVKNNQNVK